MKKTIAISLLALALAGCGGVKLSKAKKDLSVNTAISNSVFLAPVKPSERTVLVQVRNQSARLDFQFEEAVKQHIINRGYLIVEDPAQAQYILQANLLSLNETKKTPDSMADKVAGGVVGGLLGSTVGKGKGQKVGVAAGAALGTLATTAYNSDYLDITFTGIIDVRLQEKNPSGEKTDDGEYTADGQWKKHSTRINVTANKVNLKFDEAQGKIRENIAKAISGLF